MSIIIDGYNLLRSIQKDEEYQELDEAVMCAVISEYLKRKRMYGQVIFDGIGPPDKTPLGGLENLEVFFSGEELDADTVIIDRIDANTAPKNLVIISSDREIRTVADRRKATSIPSDIFWTTVVKQLDRKLPTREPREKQNGISDFETDQWLDFFDIDD